MKHLSEEQFVEWASGERNEAAAQHLRECPHCLDEVRALSLALEGFKSEVHERGAERHVPFTGAQIRALANTSAQPSRSLWKMLPVPALAAVVLAAVMLYPPKEVQAPAPNNDAADNALLLAVNSDVYGAAPVALRPAATLHKERNQLIGSQAKK